MIETINKLIQKYRRKGILVDTKLLLLYFVGYFDPSLIQRFKRTSEFNVKDFELVQGVIQRFDKLISTTNILTEVSNFSGQIAEPVRSEYFRKFAESIILLEEKQIESRLVAKTAEFVKLGLTDAGFFIVARNSYLVLTPDFRLAQTLESAGIDVINFNNLRPWGWEQFQDVPT